MTRLALALIAALMVMSLAVAWLILKDNPWKARATTAETQSTLNAETGAIADRAGQATTRIIIQSETLAHAVETAPGGDTPIPPAVRAGWSDAIGGMRERAAADPADHTDKPSR